MHYDIIEHSSLITCIIYDLSALEVAWKIQVVGSLQVDEIVYGWSIDENNPSEAIVLYLLIGVTGMSFL